MQEILIAITLPILLTVDSLLSKPTILFFDNFDSEDSCQLELTPDARNKVYKTNSFKLGHSLKKWNYSWDYKYLEGDWKQAFYVVAPNDSAMTQAGRSASFNGEAPYRITEDRELPTSVKRYHVKITALDSDAD